MIICPNCNHHNPDGSSQCENCYTPLPQTTSCPNCGASVQTDATFCGQCGFNLQVEMIGSVINIADNVEAYPELAYTEEQESSVSVSNEDLSSKDLSFLLQSPWDEEEDRPKTAAEESVPWEQEVKEDDSLETTAQESVPWEQEVKEDDSFETTAQESISWEQEVAEEQESETSQVNTSDSWDVEELPELYESDDIADIVSSIESITSTDLEEAESAAEKQDLSDREAEESQSPISQPELENIILQPKPYNVAMTGLSSATQLQLQNARLLHVQTNTIIEIPPNLSVVHIGKPNSQIPPDIDVSGFADSEVVSRIHADLRVEGDAYFIEDVGSSNGTYINHSPLLTGNRYRLRSGDRIALGKGDLVSFIFQLSE